MRKARWAWLALGGLSGSVAAADAVPDDRLGACVNAVLQVRSGQIIKVELKEEAGQQVFEFNVRGADGIDWDIECTADSASITEIEQEVTSVMHPAFARHARIDEAAARAAALAVYPGEIIEVEYEIEADGRAVYELDISTQAGDTMKVEVDAGTGLLIEADRELWQIGYE